MTRVGRILWNRRPEGRDRGDIDEIVLYDATTVHVEQTNLRSWWIGVYLDDGRYWMGDFIADHRGRMRFVEKDTEGIDWDENRSHDE